MRRTTLLVPLAIGLVAPSTARADGEQTTHAAIPFSSPWFFRILAGGGGVPELPRDDNAGHVVLTAEIGHQPVADKTGEPCRQASPSRRRKTRIATGRSSPRASSPSSI